MFQVVKDIISSVSIDPNSHSEDSSSDSDLSDSDLATDVEHSLSLKATTEEDMSKPGASDSKAKESPKRPESAPASPKEPAKAPAEPPKGRFSPRLFGRRTPPKEKASPRPAEVPPQPLDGPVDEYMNERLVKIIARFYEEKGFEEYTKVRDYTFQHSKLELLSKFREGSNLKEFLVHGVIDVPMENLLTLVMELSNRTRWDDTYLEHAMLSFDEATKTDFIFSVSKYPFPLTKRTYVVTRTCYSYGYDCLIIFSATTNKVEQPKKLKWATQVDDFESVLVVKNCPPEEVNGVKKVTKSHMLATYYENPKVLLPTSYLNFLIGQLVPGILSKMVIASQKLDYEESVKYVKTMKLIPIPKRG